MKSKSIAASTRRTAHTAGGARLGDVEEAGRHNRHDQIERGAAKIEGEGPVG